MEEIRVEKKDIYQIKVNDKGEYIEFDLQDIGAKLRLIKSLEEIEKVRDNLKKQLYIINKRQDVPGKYVSKNTKDMLELWEKSYKDMRKAMDLFLGEGACQKIFGDRNYPSMYDDLMEQLAPHLEKMKVSYKDIIESIESKYSNKNKKVIE